MFDENAIDHTDKVKKGQNVWPSVPSNNVKQQSFAESKPAFAIYKDEPAKNQRQVLAPITQSLEDSACSFASMNTSLHHIDYVLQPRLELLKDAQKIQVSCNFFSP